MQLINILLGLLVFSSGPLLFLLCAAINYAFKVRKYKATPMTEEWKAEVIEAKAIIKITGKFLSVWLILFFFLVLIEILSGDVSAMVSLMENAFDKIKNIILGG